MKLKVAAYCRVSTDSDDQANSLENQRLFFNSYIKNNKDWHFVEVYYDEGITGTSTQKRAGFNRMIADANSGLIDLILTKEVSRFARNTVDTLSYTRRLKSKGVGVLFINDNINTNDADGELRLTIMASIAQEESRKTSLRVKWGQTRRMEQGFVFGHSPLGYDVKDGVLSINPEEAKVVKLIFHKFLNEGKGSSIIARELMEDGIRPKTAKTFANSTITRILRNEKYVGDLLQKKNYTPDYLTQEQKRNIDAEEKIYIRDHHEAIIDRDTWDKVQAELKRRSPSAEIKKKYSNRYWCSGKIICGLCGGTYVPQYKKVSYGEYKSWRCTSNSKYGREKIRYGMKVGCNNIHANEQVLRTCVLNTIINIQENSSRYIDEITKNIKAINSISLDTDTSAMYSKIENFNLKKSRLIDFVMDGVISKEEMVKQKEYYDQEIDDIKKIIENVEQKIVVRNKQISLLESRIKDIDKLITTPLDYTTSTDLLEYLKVLPDNLFLIKLTTFPFEVRVVYETTGRAETYKTVVKSFDILS